MVALDRRRSRRREIEVSEWNDLQKTWNDVPMRLSTAARLKNLVFNAGWVQSTCLGAHPAPGGFSFDYMMTMWDGPSRIWRATYSTARRSFDLKKLSTNPYDTRQKDQKP
ncbi:MAG: hypothetical protein ABUU24_06390 [Variovorax sp.]